MPEERRRRVFPVHLSRVGERRDVTVETLRTIQRHAETLRVEADRILANCLTGNVDTQGLSEDLHEIDRAAACIRAHVTRWDANGQ
jgi:hypothetical protein